MRVILACRWGDRTLPMIDEIARETGKSPVGGLIMRPAVTSSRPPCSSCPRVACQSATERL